MGVEDELIKIRMELEGQAQTVAGIKETVEAEKGLGTQTKKTGDAAEKSAKKQLSLSRAYGDLHTKAKLALGFLGVGGLFAVESAIHSTEELGKTTAGLVRNFDLQNNVASRWGAIAYARGIDSKALGMTFVTLSTKLTAAAREGGKALLPFHQLGLSQEDAAKGAHNFEWGIMRVAQAFGEEEGGAKRAAAAKALLGKGYATLLPLFSEGAEGLQEQLHWADEYGVTLSGSTTDAIMEMVTSQRELKMAQLGVQVSMTRALMPAIEAGEDQVKEFIKTLNDPNLSAEQKVRRIEEQFEGLERDLIRVIERALPQVAEHAGQLGLMMAGAVWHGFIHTNFEGKLLISAWLLKAMGGDALIKAQAARVGGMIGRKVGTEIGVGIVAAVIGYEIYEHLSEGTKQAVYDWAVNAGQNFVNGLIKVINVAIQEINQTLDDANALAVFGVEAPNIGEVGEVNFHDPVKQQEERAHRLMEEGFIEGPGGKPVRPGGHIDHPKHQHHKQKQSSRLGRVGTGESSRLDLGSALSGAGPPQRPLLVQLVLPNGDVLAEQVVQATEDAESLQ